MEDFARPDLVFQIGLAPSRIDLVTSIDGVDFDEAWADRVESGLDIPRDAEGHVIGELKRSR